MPGLMTAPLAPLIFCAVWALGLLLLFAVTRLSRKRASEAPAHSPIAGADINAIENLPVFAGLYAIAFYTHAATPLALIGWGVCAARVLQTLLYIPAHNKAATRLRALMQFAQIICYAWLGAAALMVISR